MKSTQNILWMLCAIMLYAFLSCQQPDHDPQNNSNRVARTTAERSDRQASKPIHETAGRDLQQRTEDRAEHILTAMKNANIEALSAFVHPEEGVRLSPYGYVNVETDRVLTPPQMLRMVNDSTRYLWGHYDGTGDPIRLSFSEYLGAFCYDKDFIEAPEKTYQKIINRGNTLNNAREVYPDAIILEYHFPGFEPDYGGMDWESLRIVLKEFSGQLYLTGIIHDQWTI